MSEWEITEMGNLVLDGGDFFISFRANTSELSDFFTGDDDGKGETALYYDGEYKILNGDFRKDYEKRIKSLTKCLEFYKSQKNKNNSRWST